MIREELEYFLERGDRLGFVKETDSADYLGYILLNKEKPNDRFLALLKPGENPRFAEKQELIRRRPYHVLVQEMRRDVYERGECESSADYRLTENHRFASLNETQEFLDQFGLKLEDIRWAREIPGA
jgi:hypothetical protein